MFWISAALILLIVFVALFPGLFTQTPPNNDCQLANSNGGPADGHPLGFTKQGCDIYSRIIHGTSTSLVGRPHRDAHRRDRSASSSAPSRASTAAGSTRCSRASATSSSRSPTSSRPSSSCRCSRAVPQRLGHLARDRLLRVAVHGARAAIRDPAGEELRLRDGVRRRSASRGSRIMLRPRAAELDRAGHRHHDDLRSRRRSSPRRRCRSSASACRRAIDVVGQRHRARRRPTLRTAPQALIYPSIALSVTVLRVHHARRGHPRRARPEGEGPPMTEITTRPTCRCSAGHETSRSAFSTQDGLVHGRRTA